MRDLEDGASEEVQLNPARPDLVPIDTAAVARSPAGGGVNRLAGLNRSASTEFIILRKAGQPAAKIALQHARVFKALWQVWEGARVSGADDPGVSVAEIAKKLEEQGAPMATSSLSSTLRSLVSNGIVRSVDHYIGDRGRRPRYYPTDAGLEALALAEVLGEGSYVQVGRKASAWESRSNTEPNNLFQHAARIGSATRTVDPH